MCVSPPPGPVTASRRIGVPNGMKVRPWSDDLNNRLTVVLKPNGDDTKTLSCLSTRMNGSPPTAEKSASVLCPNVAAGGATPGVGVAVGVGVGVAVGVGVGVAVGVGVGVGLAHDGS